MKKTVEVYSEVDVDEIISNLNINEKKELLSDLIEDSDISVECIGKLIEKNFHKDDIQELMNLLVHKFFKKTNLKFNEDIVKLTQNYYQLTEEEINFIEKVCKRFV